MTDAGPSRVDDAVFMRRALELAERGWGRVAPNPLVGAVIVRDGRIVGEGWHDEYGEPHAEVEAIRAAGDQADGATMYVTLEPCTHIGKTPPCVEAIRKAGIKRVVYAAADPNPRARGGAAHLAEAGIETIPGVEEEAARSLNPAFFHRFTHEGREMPWLELKLALSLDGRIADSEGTSTWITGEPARMEVHRLRAGADAIVVGIGTALADDPALTVRGPVVPRVPPARVIFDRDLRLPPDGRLARSATHYPVWVLCSPDADAAARSRLEAAGVHILESSDLRDSLQTLRAVGLLSIFCEGGARLASSLLRADLVDRLTLFYAPLLLGPTGIDPFRGMPNAPLEEAHRWKLVRSATFGADTLVSVER